MKKVLVIEDDLNIAELVGIHLKDLNCEVTCIHEGKKGLLSAFDNAFDLIILDIMLPELDGVEICRRLRAEKILTPILMLTARTHEIDKVLGLETGADDYLTKPFSIRELIARVKAIFRRMEMGSSENRTGKKAEVIPCGNLQIDMDKRKVMKNKGRIELTPKEFDLLVLLAKNPGRTYSRERILNLVWGYEFEGYEHTVNSHINRLRAKIEENLSHPKYILTTWGVGYRFADKE